MILTPWFHACPCKSHAKRKSHLFEATVGHRGSPSPPRFTRPQETPDSPAPLIRNDHRRAPPRGLDEHCGAFRVQREIGPGRPRAAVSFTGRRRSQQRGGSACGVYASLVPSESGGGWQQSGVQCYTHQQLRKWQQFCHLTSCSTNQMGFGCIECLDLSFLPHCQAETKRGTFE